MEGRGSFLSFWGILIIVTAAHIALLGVTLEPNPPAPKKPLKKIRISLAAGSATAAEVTSAPPKTTVRPKPPPKRKPPKPKKKPLRPEKKAVKRVPLKEAQLLAAPPIYEPPTVSAEETPEAEEGTWDYGESGAVTGGSGSIAGVSGGRGVPSAAAVKAENGYVRYLRERLRKLRHYPLRARKMQMQGEVEVTFVILPNGRVQSVRVSRPCPHGVLNDATEAAIRSITRFRPLPPELGREPLEVTVPFIYRLK